MPRPNPVNMAATATNPTYRLYRSGISTSCQMLCSGSQRDTRGIFRLLEDPARHRLAGRRVEGPPQRAFRVHSIGFAGLGCDCRLFGHGVLPDYEPNRLRRRPVASEQTRSPVSCLDTPLKSS